MPQSASSLRSSFSDIPDAGAASGQGSVVSSAGRALCLLGAAGELLAATPEFEALFNNTIFVFNGRMRAARPEENAALQALISSLLAPSAQQSSRNKVVRLTRPDDTVVSAHGICVSGGLLPEGAPVAILMVDMPSPAAATETLLCEAYGLTVAEARLASRLAVGAPLKEAAAAENITYETARSRLKTIFRKTDTRRQAELVLLLSRSR